MPSAAEYRAAWGAENTVPYPRELWMDVLPAPAAAYPPIDFLPLELVAVFSGYLEGDVELYDQVDVQIAEGKPIRLMLIGAVPANGDMWFVLNAESGEVMLLDVEAPSLETTNSSFAKFTEFLYHFARFIDADTGGTGRAARAAALKQQLRDVDPQAFADPDSWWPAVMQQLSSAG